MPAATASADVSGYSAGDAVEMQVIALAGDGTASDPSTPVVHVIGVNDPPVPGALDAGSITVTGGLGHATVSLATGADPDLNRIQLYRVPAGGTLDRDAHAAGAPFAALPSTTLGYIDGKETVDNTSGAAGDLNIETRKGAHLFNQTGLDRTDIGANVYVVDDNTVGATGTLIAGKLVQIETAGAWVEIL